MEECSQEGIDKFLEYITNVHPETCISHDLFKIQRRNSVSIHWINLIQISTHFRQIQLTMEPIRVY